MKNLKQLLQTYKLGRVNIRTLSMSENVETFYEQKDYSHKEEGKFFAAEFDDKSVMYKGI